MGDVVKTLSQDNWDAEVLRSPVPVLVDFWADWCAPCKTMAPSVEQVARQFQGRLRVGKLNVVEAAEIAARYYVVSMPTLLVLKGGQVADQRVSALSKDQLIKFVEPYLT